MALSACARQVLPNVPCAEILKKVLVVTIFFCIFTLGSYAVVNLSRLATLGD